MLSDAKVCKSIIKIKKKKIYIYYFTIFVLSIPR